VEVRGRSSTGAPTRERIRSPDTIPPGPPGSGRSPASTPTPLRAERSPAPSRFESFRIPRYRLLEPGGDVVTAHVSVTAVSGRLHHPLRAPLPAGNAATAREVDDRQDLDRRVRLAESRRPDIARIEQEQVEEAPHENGLMSLC